MLPIYFYLCRHQWFPLIRFFSSTATCAEKSHMGRSNSRRVEKNASALFVVFDYTLAHRNIISVPVETFFRHEFQACQITELFWVLGSFRLSVALVVS